MQYKFPFILTKPIMYLAIYQFFITMNTLYSMDNFTAIALSFNNTFKWAFFMIYVISESHKNS